MECMDLAKNFANTVKRKALNDDKPSSKLGKFIAEELDGIDEEIFFEAKWKILDVVKDATRANLQLKNKRRHTNINTNTSTSSTEYSNKHSKTGSFTSTTIEEDISQQSLSFAGSFPDEAYNVNSPHLQQFDFRSSTSPEMTTAPTLLSSITLPNTPVTNTKVSITLPNNPVVTSNQVLNMFPTKPKVFYIPK